MDDNLGWSELREGVRQYVHSAVWFERTDLFASNHGESSAAAIYRTSIRRSRFDVLLTLDKNIPYQQDLKLGRIAILIVRAPSNRIQDLLPVIPGCLAALRSIKPGQVVNL